MLCCRYLNISATKHLHYYFIECENGDPTTTPTVLWFNGGPGCSSLDGWAYEHGPFRINDTDPTQLYHFDYTWAGLANMLYIEAPVGVGFSYSDDKSDYPKCNDDNTALDNLAAVEKFYQLYPEHAKNDLWITGESCECSNGLPRMPRSRLTVAARHGRRRGLRSDFGGSDLARHAGGDVQRRAPRRHRGGQRLLRHRDRSLRRAGPAVPHGVPHGARLHAALPQEHHPRGVRLEGGAAVRGLQRGPWRDEHGVPTPPSPLFLGRFSPVFRRFSAVLLRCPASWRRDGENGRKMAENGRNLGEKRARNSGG